MKRLSFLLLFFFISLSIAFSQRKQLVGKVTLFGEYPILNAEVSLKKSKRSVFTDSLGLFSIRCGQGDKIYVRAAGFKPTTVKVKNLVDTLVIELLFKNTIKNVDLATGSGHIDKDHLSQAIDHLNVEKINTNYTDVLEMIKGRFAGVTVLANEIHIRGPTSLMGSNAALIVIDGVVSDMAAIRSLPVAEVKSIDILKGSKAGLYGSRGANGVVVITMKDGN